MAAPAGVVMLIALAVRSARPRFLPAALLSLTAVLVGFQLWVWLAVPARESALSWVLYHPLCLVTLVAVGLASAVRGVAKRPPAA